MPDEARERQYALLGVTKDSIYGWIDNRGLRARKVGRLWKFKLSEVDEWVRAGGADGAKRVSEEER